MKTDNHHTSQDTSGDTTITDYSYSQITSSADGHTRYKRKPQDTFIENTNTKRQRTEPDKAETDRTDKRSICMSIVNYQRQNNSNPSFTVTENRLSEQVPAAQTIWSSLDCGDSGGIRKRRLEDNLDTCLRRVKRMKLNDGNETMVNHETNEENMNFHESGGGVTIIELNENEPNSGMEITERETSTTTRKGATTHNIAQILIIIPLRYSPDPLLTRNDNIVHFIAETCVMNTEVGRQLIELELIQEEWIKSQNPKSDDTDEEIDVVNEDLRGSKKHPAILPKENPFGAVGQERVRSRQRRVRPPRMLPNFGELERRNLFLIQNIPNVTPPTRPQEPSTHPGPSKEYMETAGSSQSTTIAKHEGISTPLREIELLTAKLFSGKDAESSGNHKNNRQSNTMCAPLQEEQVEPLNLSQRAAQQPSTAGVPKPYVTTAATKKSKKGNSTTIREPGNRLRRALSQPNNVRAGMIRQHVWSACTPAPGVFMGLRPWKGVEAPSTSRQRAMFDLVSPYSRASIEKKKQDQTAVVERAASHINTTGHINTQYNHALAHTNE
ncbi:hypothetical protein QAD02_008860 [Eretmocerus hayati]|uniref:Uncharacterized protein n=1 Tax=Eretmocerus hayati TaxID=131215 RepID=A0ACC2N8E6_9HYME|nr:hypothetical protein QAD02_008860 [Eretmocerus hayati]